MDARVNGDALNFSAKLCEIYAESYEVLPHCFIIHFVLLGTER